MTSVARTRACLPAPAHLGHRAARTPVGRSACHVYTRAPSRSCRVDKLLQHARAQLREGLPCCCCAAARCSVILVRFCCDRCCCVPAPRQGNLQRVLSRAHSFCYTHQSRAELLPGCAARVECVEWASPSSPPQQPLDLPPSCSPARPPSCNVRRASLCNTSASPTSSRAGGHQLGGWPSKYAASPADKTPGGKPRPPRATPSACKASSSTKGLGSEGSAVSSAATCSASCAGVLLLPSLLPPPLPSCCGTCSAAPPSSSAPAESMSMPSASSSPSPAMPALPCAPPWASSSDSCSRAASRSAGAASTCCAATSSAAAAAEHQGFVSAQV